MNHYYLLLTQAFSETYNGYQEGPNVFNCSLTNDGRYVCSANALNEFPAIFAGVAFQIIQLSASDFPGSVDPFTATYTLAQLKTLKISQLERQTRAYVNAHYDTIERDALQMIFSQAMITENVQVMERVGQVMGWCGTVMAYNTGKIIEINACVDQAVLDAVTVDFDQFDATDPLVSTSEFV